MSVLKTGCREDQTTVAKLLRASMYTSLEFLKQESLKNMSDLAHPNGRDKVAKFEQEAGKRVIKIFSDFAKEHRTAVQLLVDSLPPETVGTGTPTLLVIFDPVNGSRNFRHASGAAACSAAAMLGAERTLSVENLEIAAIKDIDSESAGGFNGQQVNTGRRAEIIGQEQVFTNWRFGSGSSVLPLSESLVAFNLRFRPDFNGWMRKRIWTLIDGIPSPDDGPNQRLIGDLRNFGCASLSAVYVAKGSVSAYVNIGTKSSTIYDLAAGAVVVLSQKGYVSRPDGQPLGVLDAADSGKTYDYILANNSGIYQELVAHFKED